MLNENERFFHCFLVALSTYYSIIIANFFDFVKGIAHKVFGL
jgi:hypothetical protein